MKGRWLWISLAAVVLVQTAILLWMVLDRWTILNTGREVTLAVEPVDPRSLFRGDYVILSYGAISQLSGVDITAATAGGAEALQGQPVFITLGKGADGNWERRTAALSQPKTVAPDEIMMRGLIDRVWQDGSGGTAIVRYGIESFFVQESLGVAIEDKARAGKVAVQVAVDKRGRAQIKGLLIDGAIAYSEPGL